MKKKFVPYIDRMCRGYGEEFFGKDAMDEVTDAQVEEARIQAFIQLSELVVKTGPQEGNERFKQLFCNYVFANFM